MALKIWVPFPRVRTYANVTSATRYKTANALRRAALAEARGAKVWARFDPSASFTSGDAHLQIDVRAIVGVTPLFVDGGKQSEA